jgi:glycosyltransferase involved in cell wall biosynthesis
MATYCPYDWRREIVEKSFQDWHEKTGSGRQGYELIIINNGGNHRDLLEGLEPDLLIDTNHNIGQGAGLNIGAILARANTLMFTDDDMRYEPGWLRYGVAMLNKYPDYVVSLRKYGHRYKTGDAGGGNVYSRKAGGVWFMRRWLWQKVGRFGMTYYDFGGLWTRNLIRSGSRFVVSKKAFISQIARKRSIIGGKRSKIAEFRNPRTT